MPRVLSKARILRDKLLMKLVKITVFYDKKEIGCFSRKKMQRTRLITNYLFFDIVFDVCWNYIRTTTKYSYLRIL